MDELVFPQGIKVEELTDTSGKISFGSPANTTNTIRSTVFAKMCWKSS